NRIGQGIEFDYCCCHASFALKDEGYETIMVNCNPETVSTDYDTSDRLYFEPLTLEDVLHIVREEKPNGVIVQFGGQTPLNLALDLQHSGVPIIGTSPDSIDVAALCDDEQVVIGGIMEHIEEAGVHSGDSSCVLPAYQLSEDLRETIRKHTVNLGRALNVVGLMNIQFAVRAGKVYVLEVNP